MEKELDIRNAIGDLIAMLSDCNETQKAEWIEYAIKMLKEA